MAKRTFRWSKFKYSKISNSILELKKLLAVMIVLLFIFVQVYLLMGIVDIEMREMVMRSLGTLDALLGIVFNYFFGSSDSARSRQNEAQLANTLPITPAEKGKK